MVKKSTAVIRVRRALQDAERALVRVEDDMDSIASDLTKLEGETTYRTRIVVQRAISEVHESAEGSLLTVEHLKSRVASQDS